MKTYDEALLNSLKKQEGDFEIIAIDNRENKYSSAAKALNYGASISKGKYLVFCHQDIEISNARFIKEIVEYLEMKPNTVLGIGVPPKNVSNLK